MISSNKVIPHSQTNINSEFRNFESAESNEADIESPSPLPPASPECLNDAAVDSLSSKLVLGLPITLREQLDIEFLDKRRQEAHRKMLRKIEQEEEDKMLKTKIIAFMYATDYTFLRRSSPDEVWEAILRREAWRQIPFTLVIVSLVQLGICTIVMIVSSAPVNLSTLIMAIMYVLAMATSNPFTISKDLTVILTKLHSQCVKTRPQQIFFVALCIILFPVLFIALACAYAVTVVLDFTSGPILDVSYGSMVNILVNIVVVFSALSIGLRSEDPINAIQTFVGFDFVNCMDEAIISTINVDLMAATTRVKKDNGKMLFVRITVYICTAMILAGTFYLTVYSHCYILCSGGGKIIVN